MGRLVDAETNYVIDEFEEMDKNEAGTEARYSIGDYIAMVCRPFLDDFAPKVIIQEYWLEIEISNHTMPISRHKAWLHGVVVKHTLRTTLGSETGLYETYFTIEEINEAVDSIQSQLATYIQKYEKRMSRRRTVRPEEFGKNDE